MAERLLCPKGHRVRPALLTAMTDYYWCGKCTTWRHGPSMAGGPIRGMYYPPSMLALGDPVSGRLVETSTEED